MGPQPPEYLTVFQASPRRPGQVLGKPTRIKRRGGNGTPNHERAEARVGHSAAGPDDFGAGPEPEPVPRVRAGARAGAYDVDLELLRLFPSSTSDVPPPDRLAYLHTISDRPIGSGLEASTSDRPDAAPNATRIASRDSPHPHPPLLGSVDEPQTANDSMSNSSSMHGVVPGEQALRLALGTLHDSPV